MRFNALLAITAVAMVGACDETTEPGQSAGAGASSGTPTSTGTNMVTDCGDAGATALEANCLACAESGCCTELAACDTAGCSARLGCEVACADDATCLADCAAMYPDDTAASAVTRCLTQSCEVCAPPTAICGTDLSVGSPACDACIDENCCTEVAACVADSDCRLCVESGEPSLCEQNTVYDDTITCFDDNCLTSCGG